MGSNKTTSAISIIDVTTENVSEVGIFCIKDKKSPGYAKKVDWFKSKLNKGLRIKIAVNEQHKQLGFIEYIPSELAWRPIKAANYLFIQCIALFVTNVRNTGIASALLKQCVNDAQRNGKNGVCVMSSNGPWMANKTLFEKNGFVIADQLDRFELLYKKLKDDSHVPKFVNWNEQLGKYKGWNLIYSDQCPWHDKSITDLKQLATDIGIDLKAKKLRTPKEAQNAPSGFGTYSLIKDGRLLADHYISSTRFKNILKKEKT